MYFNRVYTIPFGKDLERGFKICCSGMLGHNFMHCQKFVSKWWYLWYTHATRHLWWLGQQWLLVPNRGQLPFYQCMLGRNSWSIHITRYLKQNYSHHWSILPVTSWRDHPRRVRRPSCMRDNVTVIDECKQDTPTSNTRLNKDFQISKFHKFETMKITMSLLCYFI